MAIRHDLQRIVDEFDRRSVAHLQEADGNSFDAGCAYAYGQMAAMVAGLALSREYPKVTVNGERIGVHRYIWEQVNGRRLPPGWVVHHKDLDPTNNHPDNLQAMRAEDHSALHLELRQTSHES